MKKILLYSIVIFAVSFLLFFPYIHVGGTYYRGLLLVWNKYPLVLGKDSFFPVYTSINLYKLVWWADPLTFQYVEGDYAVDRNYVYLGQRLDNFDPKTFKPLGNGFYGDKDSVRMFGGLIKKKQRSESPPENFDPETFQYIGANFVKDKSGIYYLTNIDKSESEFNKYHKYEMTVDIFRRVEIADLETFVHIGDCRFKDKNFDYKAHICGKLGGDGISVGYNSSGAMALEIIQPSDKDSFQDAGCYFYITQKGVFWSDNEIVAADKETFEIFNKGTGNNCKFGFYAKDKNFVYYKNSVVRDADALTFKVINVNGFEGEDKNHRYSFGEKVK